MEGDHSQEIEQQSQNGMSRSGGENTSDEDARKLFVGALPPIATKEHVQEYFQKFGAVEMCTIKTDVYTGRSRGFGFVIFQDVAGVNAVLNHNDPEGHVIQGKRVDPKIATPQNPKGEEKSTKVFVGGLEKGTTKEDITAAFESRGNVVDVYLPTDRATGEQKGFAFVNFDNSSLAEQLCIEGKVIINNKECDIKKANNKNERGGMRGGGMRGGFRGGRGGRGGGGGWGGSFYDQYSAGYVQGGGYGGGYDQYGGSGYGYQGGYGGAPAYGGGGYDQYGSGGYDHNSGYSNGNYGGGYGQNNWGQGGSDQYKMKAGRGRGGGGYQPY